MVFTVEEKRVEEREEVSGDEVSFLRKGKREEMAKSEREKGRRREDCRETTAMVVGERENGMSNTCEV